MFEREVSDLLAVLVGQWAAADDDGTDVLGNHHYECTLEFFVAVAVNDFERQIELSRRGLERCETVLRHYLTEYRYSGKAWDHFLQQGEVLRLDLATRVTSQAGDVAARPPQARDEPGSYGIRRADKHDGNRRGRALCGGDVDI